MLLQGRLHFSGSAFASVGFEEYEGAVGFTRELNLEGIFFRGELGYLAGEGGDFGGKVGVFVEGVSGRGEGEGRKGEGGAGSAGAGCGGKLAK